MGKTSKRRPQLVDMDEFDLRWELSMERPSEERKKEILAELERRKGEKGNPQ